jgi:hypothetical protein
MGYLRPVSQYNLGKKSEFYSRKHYKIDEAMLQANPRERDLLVANRRFASRYGNPAT